MKLCIAVILLIAIVRNSSARIGGVVYTRWGSSTCPYTSTRVYSGAMAGTSYQFRGGASNMLCMPFNPDYYYTRSGTQGHSYLNGAEYAQPLHVRYSSPELNAPCAVCTVYTRSQVLMIPGKIYCPSSWTREYFGYLMSESGNEYRSTFTCIDKYQEGLAGSRGHSPASDLWHVEASCSGLKCPPYSPSKELTCVVCTK